MPGFLSSFYLALTMFFPGLLTSGTTPGLDAGMVSEIMEIVVQVVTAFVGLFTLWPLNLFLILGIIGFAVGFFFKGKRGVRR